MHRNTTKKIAQKEKTITLQAKEIAENKSAIEHLHVKLTSLEPKIEKLQKERHRAANWKQRASQMKSLDQIVEDIVKQQEQSLKLAKEVDQLLQDNADLQRIVDKIMEPNHKNLIVTFCDGKYTNDVRACYYELLSLNVGTNNVVPIITAVLQSFTDKTLGRIPSKTLLSNMMIECLT